MHSYLDQGEGPPLLLLHGGLATAEMNWSGRIGELAKRFRVLAPDARGHGGTPNPSGSLSYPQLADDAVAFCETLGVTQPLVLGYSDGGQAALEMAMRRPGFARAYVFGATLSQPTDAYLKELRSWGFTAPGEVDLEALSAAFGPFLDAIKRVHKGNGEPEYWRSLLSQISTLWLTLPTYSETQLRTISEPALVITGDRDELADHQQAVRIYAALPKGELAIVPDANHSAVNGDAFWQLVMPFLERHAAR